MELVALKKYQPNVEVARGLKCDPREEFVWDRRISFEVDCGLQKWQVVISFFWPLLEQLLKSQSGSRSGNDFWAAMSTIFW
jgi:hypothetical protein